MSITTIVSITTMPPELPNTVKSDEYWLTKKKDHPFECIGKRFFKNVVASQIKL